MFDFFQHCSSKTLVHSTAQQNNPIFLVAQSMAEQNNPMLFGCTEHGTVEQRGGGWWHRTQHSRTKRWCLVTKNMAQQNKPVLLRALYTDAVNC
jgi:hypothetical protein